MSLKIYNLKDKMEYLEEVLTLEHNEWSNDKSNNNWLDKKIKQFTEQMNRNDFCKLVLLDKDDLIGFISIFPHDSEEYPNLTPWYSTMYVKTEYRGCKYSKLLNDAILDEAKNRGFKTIYLKTTLENYYEKFGAIFIKRSNKKEKLYKFELSD